MRCSMEPALFLTHVTSQEVCDEILRSGQFEGNLTRSPYDGLLAAPLNSHERGMLSSVVVKCVEVISLRMYEATHPKILVGSSVVRSSTHIPDSP